MDQTNDTTKMESKNVYVVISKADLLEICSRASKVGAEAGIEAYKAQQKEEGARIKDRRYHNTEILLRNYHLFRISLSQSIYDIHQISDDVTAQDILNMMENRDTDTTVESIKQSTAKTAVIIKHIDRMLDLYRVACEQSGDDVAQRRYHVLCDRYIADPGLSIDEIADKYCVSKVSIYGDLKAAKEQMSALIFGIDGIKR